MRQVPLREYAPILLGEDYDKALDDAWARQDLQKDIDGLPMVAKSLRRMFDLGYAAAVRDAAKRLSK